LSLHQAYFGKYYLTTSQDLDYAREQFTFDISSLASYVLGQAQHGSISLPRPEETAENAQPQAASSGNTGNSTIEIDVLQVMILSCIVFDLLLSQFLLSRFKKLSWNC